MKPKKINRTFNNWRKPATEQGPPDESHYSVTRDRGTVKAEAMTGLVGVVKDVHGRERIVCTRSVMPVPPKRFNGPLTRAK